MITNKNTYALDAYAYALILVNKTPDVNGSKNGTTKKKMDNNNSIFTRFLIRLINPFILRHNFLYFSS